MADPLSLTDRAALATDDAFINRVMMAALKAAADVMNETPTADTPTRVAWAQQIMRNQYGAAQSIAAVIAAQGTLTSASTDSDIEWTVASVWNAMAGVTVSAT